MVPQWEGVFERYTRGFVARNIWRVRDMDPDDAVQECACVFVWCCNHYGNVVDNPAWFMALYKQALFTLFITMSHKARKQRALTEMLTAQELTRPVADPYANLGPAMVHLQECSDDLKTVLKLLSEAPQQVIEMLFRGNNTMLINRRLRRFCKLASFPDIIGELQSLA